MNDVSIPLAFIAGILSFLSPCVLPLVPAYISLVTGMSLEELKGKPNSSRALLSSLCFVSGFSIVFIAMGASSSILGSFFIDEYKDYLRIIGGCLTIIFGLFTAGLLKFQFMMRIRRIDFKHGAAGYTGAFIIGMSFAAGWTPCIGPILGSILFYASSQGTGWKGLQLLMFYSAGLALPFLLSTFAVNYFFTYTRRLNRFMNIISVAGGVVLICFGILLLSDSMRGLSSYIPDLGIKF